MSNIVAISIEDDVTPKKDIRTTVKTYRVDNAQIPVQILLPFNTSRIKARISNVNTSIVLGKGPIPTGTSGTTATLAPDGETIILNTSGNGNRGTWIYGPEQWWAQSIQGNAATLVVVEQIYYA